MIYKYIYIYIYICIYIYKTYNIYRERIERIEQSRKKVFIKDSMSKRTKNVIFIYFAFLIIK